MTSATAVPVCRQRAGSRGSATLGHGVARLLDAGVKMLAMMSGHGVRSENNIAAVRKVLTGALPSNGDEYASGCRNRRAGYFLPAAAGAAGAAVF